MVNTKKPVSPLSLSRRWVRCLVIAMIVVTALPMIVNKPTPVKASNLPNGFVETLLAQGLNRPSGINIAPDGRVFVTLKSGKVMIIKNGILLTTPFVTVTTSTTGDLGLEGVGFDPNFATNHYVYLYYTATTPTVHNRLSRFVANGDVAAANSETYLYESETLDPSSIMNVGGSIWFGPDGKLYLSTGDAEIRANSQDLSNTLGKILRMNPDGSIPTDNPFYTTLTGMNRLIYAYGLRNPFTTDIQRGTGRMFADDVGDNTWEEIDEIKPGANFGWPTYEGPSNAAGFTTPLYYYGHGSTTTTGCAITGGTFYNPQTPQFPSSYVGTYFFQDYCSGWIRNYNPSTGQVTDFASGLVYPVGLRSGADGSLYYVAQGSNTQSGVVYQIQYVINQPPSVPQPVEDQRVSNGYPATFTVYPSGSSPFTYQWQRNDVNIPGATSSSYTLSPAQLSDSGANFRVVVTNAYGTVTSNEAKLTVITQQPPTASITSPADGTLYNAGNTITYSGSATDPQDGTLPASAYTWEIRFQHNTHYHQLMSPTSGYTSSTFTTPTIGEPSANTWFRIVLTVTDSYGLSYTTYRDIHPHTSNIALQTNPPGLQLSLDDTPAQSPIYFTGVVNFTRQISAPDVQRVNGQTWLFDRWSDGGADIHNINTPANNTTYIAYYHQQGAYQAQGGQLVIEAETYDNGIARGGQSWIFRNGLYGFAGTGYMLANPMQGTSYPTNYVGNSPELQYQANFTTPGLYYIWVRYNAPSSNTGAAVHIGLDGQAVSSAAQIKDPSPVVGDWGWTNKTIPGPIATINIPSAGMHTVNVWMDQDGYRLDKVVLTTDSMFVPADVGPAESSRAAMPTPTLAPTTVPITATPTANGTVTPNGTATMTFAPPTSTKSNTPVPSATNTLMPSSTPVPAATNTLVPATKTPSPTNTLMPTPNATELFLTPQQMTMTAATAIAATHNAQTQTAQPTRTPAVATNTPSAGTGLKVQYLAANTTDTTNEIDPYLKIVNNSSSSIAMSQLKVRYWFTRDSLRTMVFGCAYAALKCANITGTFTYLASPATNADTYLEVSFSSATANLPAFSDTSDIQLFMHNDIWSNFSQSNDYSFDATKTAYADFTRITLYNNGVLVWGTEPSGIPTATPTSTPTHTPVPPTPNPSATPTKTNTPDPANNFKVQYMAGFTPDITNELAPYLKIFNNTGSSIAMSQLKVRYWFTRDTARPLVFGCAYAALKCANVTGAFSSVTTPTTTADTYLEVSFTSAAGSLAAGSDSGEIQTFLHKDDWSNFTQSNDYSFDATKTAYADFTRITLYNNGVLVWGTEPTTGSASFARDVMVDAIVSPPTSTPLPASTPVANASADGSDDPVDVALDKPATQSSSVKGPAANGQANLAVDGNHDASPKAASTARTDIDANAWWQVDLGSSYNIRAVNIWNQSGAAGQHLSKFYIFVSDAPFTSADLQATLKQPGVSAYYVDAQAGLPTDEMIRRTGRYVRIQLTAKDSLSLPEVEVLGFALPSDNACTVPQTPLPPPTNIALKKSATQSSDAKGADHIQASFAVDGNHDGKSATQTGSDVNAWWQVDLGTSYNIRAVNVWNRADALAQHLNQFYIIISDTPFTSSDLKTTLNQPGISAYYINGQAGLPTNQTIKRTGRYIRIQLTTTDSLSLSEVEVMGFALPTDGAGCGSAPTPTPIPTSTPTPTPTPVNKPQA